MAHVCKYRKYKKKDEKGNIAKRWLCRGCGQLRPSKRGA